MAEKHHSTCPPDSTACGKIDLRRWSIDALVERIDSTVDHINDTTAQIEAVAYGGAYYAKGKNSDGDPVDTICAGMFDSIVSMSGNARSYLMLKDLINELRGRIKKESAQ